MARRAYRHSSHGSSGGSSGGGSSGGSSGGSYSYGGSSGGSSGGGSYGGGSYGGSYGGSSVPAATYSNGYSTSVESYRVISEAPSVSGGEIIETPQYVNPISNDSTTSVVPADAALLSVEVPAGATIYVNGAKTSATGTVRQYLSRGLAVGKRYEFSVRMTVDRDGQTSEMTKVVSLAAGGRSSLSFNEASAPKTSLTLHVPADAKVWLAGNVTTSAGATRQFQTTTLATGQAWKNYEIRVVTVVDGREQVVSKVIDLAAGQEIELSLDPTQRTASTDATASVR